MNLRHYLTTLLAWQICLTASADVPEGNITFADPAVKAICVANWDSNSDGELSYSEAAAVTSLIGFSENETITNFDELQYFTGVTSIGGETFQNCSSLASINIPDGVTWIGQNAFWGCSSLASINIPDGVTSIGYAAFYNCSSLASINIPDGVTSIGANAFYCCSSLTAIIIPDGVTSIEDWAFWGCFRLTSIDIPDAVTSIGNEAFRGCSSLTVINIPDGVTSIEGKAFWGCSSLTSINIPDGVTSIEGETFQNCSRLTSINIPDGVTWIGQHAFSGCASLTAINIPDVVTSIGDYAFSGCSDLTSVTLGDGVTSIGDAAFHSCSNLTSITIPDGVTEIGNAAFSGCTSLASVNIPTNVTSINGGVFSECSSLTSLAIPEGVTSIGGSAFSGCSSLTTITIPEVVTTIGENAFYMCSNLTSITIPENVTSIGGGAFFGLQRVNLMSTTPPQITSSIGSEYTVYVVPEEAITSYRNANVWSEFNTWIVRDTKCNQVIDVSGVVVQDNQSKIETTIGQDNLLDIVSLKVSGHIDSRDLMILRTKMPNLRFLDLTDASIDANDYEYYSGYHSETNILGTNVFSDTKLHSVKLPSTLTALGDLAFANLGNLKLVTLNEGLISIGNGAFSETGVTAINFPESLESIGDGAFQRVPLKEVVSNNNLRFIGQGCFARDENLKTVILSESLETIGHEAFIETRSLNSIIVKNPLPISITDGVFTDSRIADATLYVPELESVKEKYYWANGWSGFLKREEYHPEYEVILLQDPEDLTAGDGKDQFAGVNGQAPDADLRPGSGFIKEGEEDVQQLDDVEQCISEDGTSASIIAKDDGENVGNLDIDNLSVKIRVQAYTWYFFCFPYDVKISDCTYPGDYVWKGYQGALRASNGIGWTTVTGEKLHASYGYAFLTTTEGTLIINFKNPKFGGNRTKELEESIANNPQDAHWNFVGNPYSCYYDFAEDDYSAPITLWDGTSYVAYRPGDDEIHLRPYEAFFVQRIDNVIDFHQNHRETYKQSKNNEANQAHARRVRGLNPERLMLNLYITDNNTSIADRTRVVLNENKSHGYELECDAAKFLSTDATAQIYSIENGVHYAINERPGAGDIRLGYTAKTAGRLSIGANRLDQPMMLVDTQMGTTFDLSLGTYDFDTQAGTFDGRFLLRAAGDQTGITALRKQTGAVIGTQPGGIAIGGADGKTVNVYTPGGALAAQLTGNGFIALKGGVYVVIVDGVSAKINVR